MSFTTKQKAVLWFLLVITIICFCTYFKYPWHPDHYTLGQYTHSLIEKGYAPWVLHPISLFGYYPLSIPSGFEYFFATVHALTGMDTPGMFYFFSILSALFAVAGTFLVMRQFSSFEASFIAAFVLATMVYFVKNVSNTASSRMFNIIFYPIFILVLFKIYTVYVEERKISLRYILIAALLFVFMNLVHRLGQLLFIFIIAFVMAILLYRMRSILGFFKRTWIYRFRREYYERSIFYLYIDLAVLAILSLGFLSIKVKIVWAVIASAVLIHLVILNWYTSSLKKNADWMLMLNLALIGAYALIGKVTDLLMRGRLLHNLDVLIERYMFQLTALAVLGVLVLIALVIFTIRDYKKIKKYAQIAHNKLYEMISSRPEQAISVGLFVVFLYLLSKSFTGDNFYEFGRSYYSDSFILSGNSPWITLANFIFNLNNNVTILIYFAAIGVVYLFLKADKTFYDYFFVFVAIGFSQFILDWEYIRLYMLPLYAIFIAIGLAFTMEKLSDRFSRKTLTIALIILFTLDLVVANVFIQRERILPSFGVEEYVNPISEPHFIGVGEYLKDKGDFSIHTSSSIDYDRRAAYYSGKLIVVLAESTVDEDREYEIEQVPLETIWDSFNRGQKVTSLYTLKDIVYDGEYYYFGRHTYNLNNLAFTMEPAPTIVGLYNVSYIVDSPQSKSKTPFFDSIGPVKNKVYSTGEVSIYAMKGGRA